MAHAGHLITVPMPHVHEDMDMEAVKRAISDAGEYLRQLWASLARQHLNAQTGDYIQQLDSPDAVSYPYDGDSLAVGVFNKSKHARAIEDGTESFSLPQRIRWGQTPKSKLRKDGGWYITVPLRHYTPGRAGEGASPARQKAAMPAEIHNLAKHLAFNKDRLTFRPGRVVQVTRTFGRSKKNPTAVGGLGARGGGLIEVRRGKAAQHAVSARSAGSLAAAVELAKAGKIKSAPSPWHSSSRYEGMQKTGSKGHSQYMTFRTITPESPGWIIPARKGHHLAKMTYERGRATVTAMIQAAFAKDLEAAITGGLTGSG